MNDLISRQAAIDALKSQLSDWNDDYNIPVRKSIENIEHLPSAQPEIVRCKDCEHRNTVDCPMCYLETIDWEEDGYVEVDYVFHDNTHDDGFCDRAERREE